MKGPRIYHGSYADLKYNRRAVARILASAPTPAPGVYVEVTSPLLAHRTAAACMWQPAPGAPPELAAALPSGFETVQAYTTPTGSAIIAQSTTGANVAVIATVRGKGSHDNGNRD